MIQNHQAEPPIPQNLLHRQVIDTEGFSEFSIRNGFVQRESIRKESDQEVTHWPIFHRFIENHFVSKHDHFEIASRLKASQDILARFAAGFHIQGTDTNSPW